MWVFPHGDDGGGAWRAARPSWGVLAARRLAAERGPSALKEGGKGRGIKEWGMAGAPRRRGGRPRGYFRNPVEIHGTAAMTTMPTAIDAR